MPLLNELKISKDLIRYQTITPNDNGIMRYISKKLHSLGFRCKLLKFSDKKKSSAPILNLYARRGNKGPNICYAGHTDVVPPGNYKNWTSNPFTPTIKKGHLVGRGANDMKSSIACFIAAVSEFVNSNPNFPGSISFLITGDEEGYAINGTKKVVDYLKKKKEKINFCLVGEPTNPNKLGEMIKIGRRGSLTGKIEIIGMQGHVAYPHRANNPSTIIVKVLNELKNIKFDKGAKNFQPTNLEITKINIDNKADNVIPRVANATFNIRFNNKHSSGSIKKRINKILSKISKKNKSKFKIDYRVSGEAFLTKQNATTNMIQNVVKKITKIKPKLSTTGGTSDARFLKNISPCLEFGLVGKTMHKVDEAVSLNDLKKLTKIYANILNNYF